MLPPAHRETRLVVENASHKITRRSTPMSWTVGACMTCLSTPFYESGDCGMLLAVLDLEIGVHRNLGCLVLHISVCIGWRRSMKTLISLVGRCDQF